MKKFRRISALILALALICALAISAFAVTESVTCGSVEFNAKLTGSTSSATATVTVVESGSKEYSGSIVLHYVYCNEAMVRPSNYVYASVTKHFDDVDFTYRNGYSISRSVTCTSGNVMIEASADYQMVEQTTSVTTTTTDTHLSLGLY